MQPNRSKEVNKNSKLAVSHIFYFIYLVFSSIKMTQNAAKQVKIISKSTISNPALRHSWNTMVASSFWDMRLSIACAATDAEHQNRIILHDNTSTSPSWHGSPIRTPTTAACGGAPRCRRLEGQPWRIIVSILGARSSMQPLA